MTRIAFDYKIAIGERIVDEGTLWEFFEDSAWDHARKLARLRSPAARVHSLTRRS